MTLPKDSSGRGIYFYILHHHTYLQAFSCADPGIFIRGLGGGPGQSDKKALTTVFLVLSLFYSCKWLISKKTIIFQGSRGGPTFSRGVQLFPGWGVPIAYSYRKYITCDFPGEVRTPCPPPPSGSALGTVHGTIHSCRECTKSD